MQIKQKDKHNNQNKSKVFKFKVDTISKLVPGTSGLHDAEDRPRRQEALGTSLCNK